VQHGGIGPALLLGGLFTLGMMLSDGLNGLWISWLIARADRRAARASRWMTATVACVSLAVAALGAAKLASQRWSDLLEGRETMVGIAVLIVIASCYAVAVRVVPEAAARAAGAGSGRRA